MRTNIDINDDLMAKALAVSDGATKKAVVEKGLELLVNLKGQEELRKLRGAVVWRGHDDDWFASDEEILAKRRLAAKNAAPNQATVVSDRPQAKPVEARR